LVIESFGRYSILKKVGEGGMGQVYLARDVSLDRKVALKILPDVLQNDLTAAKRLSGEARAAAALDHPYACKIYEVGEANGRSFIAMEYIEGQTLAHRIAKGPMPWMEAQKLGIEIAEVLTQAHERGIIHRDLKPSNIMQTPDGHVKVLDFGLAKRIVDSESETVLDSEQNLTDPSNTVGTVAYMSPEQVLGQVLDARSDIFSFGIIMYELMSGIHPFRRRQSMETAIAIANDPAIPLTEHQSEIPAIFEQLISRMLRKSREERFASMRELIRDLRGLQQNGQSSTTASRTVLASIAVLPMVNMSSDVDQEYFSDGITEDIIAQLSKVSGLRVIARTSIMRYKKTEKSAPEIGRELGVSNILESSVRRAGNRLRVNSSLIDAVTNRTLWSETYDREIDDVFAIQTDVSIRIAQALSASFSMAPARPVAGPGMMEAYHLYLKGRYFLNQLAPESIQKALQFFQQALELDPNYARAYAGISTCYSCQGNFGYAPNPEVLPKAKAAAERALQLDDSLAEAHASMGLILFYYDWDWNGAERSFRRAIELNYSFAEAYVQYSWLLTARERYDEAAIQARRAVEIDPLSPMTNTNLGWVLGYARRLDESLDQFRKTLEIAPDFLFARACTAVPYVTNRRYDEAVEILEKWSWSRAFVGQIYSLAGRCDEARQVLEEVLRSPAESRSSAYDIGVVYLLLGDTEPAFQWLEKAFQERDTKLPYLKIQPGVEPYLHRFPIFGLPAADEHLRMKKTYYDIFAEKGAGPAVAVHELRLCRDCGFSLSLDPAGGPADSLPPDAGASRPGRNSDEGKTRSGNRLRPRRKLLLHFKIHISAQHHAIDLCEGQYPSVQAEQSSLESDFLNADAGALPFRDGTFDVVLNLESSHLYPKFETFVSEVHRVLKPGGMFAYGDLWHLDSLPINWKQRERTLRSSRFVITREEDVTEGVFQALKKEDGLNSIIGSMKARGNKKLIDRLMQANEAMRAYLAFARCSYWIFNLRRI
jgi:serine/threonine protein kinase/Tfp pilus assembly protein PilF